MFWTLSIPPLSAAQSDRLETMRIEESKKEGMHLILTSRPQFLRLTRIFTSLSFSGQRFLCSKAFMGFTSNVLSFLTAIR